MNKHTDVIIVGSGIAALQAARTLGKYFKVFIITKSSIYTSSSYKAQGGVAAVTRLDDDFKLHTRDTLEAGVYHHYTKHVESLVENGAQSMHQLIQEGFPADKTDSGEISLGLEGAHSRSRIIHAGGDQTGKALIDYLITQLPPNVTIHTHEMAIELILNTVGDCIGIKSCKNGITNHYFAHHIILATGGSAALYPFTSNYNNNVGDGVALAYLAGATITDMEFMQFHPSLLYINGETKGLISEAVRGAGGKFIDEEGHPIMEGIHPLKDLAPRHITAFEIYKLRAQGKEVYLDISMIQNFEQKFPTITQLCKDNGIDLNKGRIPLAPGSHFSMGGIIADTVGKTSIPHLYAVGEVACTGVHGANRLASNSLLEGIAFGKNMAEYIFKQGCKQTNFEVAPTIQKPKKPSLLTKDELQQAIMQSIGIIRNEEGMRDLLEKLPDLQDLQLIDFHSLEKDEIELYFMHIVATLMTLAALERKESRGSHIRTDYPNPNNEWQQKWIIFQQGTMKVRDSIYE